MLALKQKGGGWKKILKRMGLNAKGGTSFKRGGWEVKVKIFMTKFKVKNIGIFRHSRDANFKIFSNHGGIMSKP